MKYFKNFLVYMLCVIFLFAVLISIGCLMPNPFVFYRAVSLVCLVIVIAIAGSNIADWITNFKE